ncbi:unnamed protein product [Owenia fusiformis]|nr:unnamed protein product [Owenia fusiformis]
MNDSFRTDVFVQYDPETIACACIYLAARQLQIPLPYNPPWFSILNQEEHHITEICLTILRLYARSKPNLDKLEAKVNECKKLHVEAKLKMKGLSSSNTPNSTHNSPKNISPSPLSVQNLKRQKDEDTSDHSGSGRNNYVSKKKKRHYSRSRSRSFSSRSRSRSFSSSPRRKYKSPHRKYKKESKRDDWSRTRKRKTSVSPYTNRRSYSRSPDYKTSKKSYYKDKDRYISADRYTSDRSFEKYDSKYYDKPKAKKHSNGHRRSRTPERYRR